MFDPNDLMRLAIAKSREGVAAGQSPFGCAIAVGDRLLSCEHNTVLRTTDITAHAEINALRSACVAADDIFLEKAVVATTCEPCPMCTAALHWARVRTVYFGATIDDAADGGFNELHLPAAEILRLGRSNVDLVPDTLRNECRALFAEWKATPGATAY